MVTRIISMPMMVMKMMPMVVTYILSSIMMFTTLIVLVMTIRCRTYWI